MPPVVEAALIVSTPHHPLRRGRWKHLPGRICDHRMQICYNSHMDSKPLNQVFTDLPRHIVRLAGTTLVGSIGVVLGAAAYAAIQLNERTPSSFVQEYTFSPFETMVQGYEELSFRTDDGVQLQGWWLPHAETDRVVIGLAGHRSAKSDLLGIGSALWRAGNNVLLFDWRSRGKSEVAQHSLAYYELRDAEAAVRYAAARVPSAQIGVIGYSMGAAVALLLAARSAAVRAVVADSPFTSITDVVAHGITRHHLPVRLVLPLVAMLNAWRYGYHFDAVRPIDAAPQMSPRPLLVIHGAGDSLIPVDHAHAIYAAAGEPKSLWVVEGVEHCGAYFADRAAYVARVAAFFEQYLGSIG